jgi:hypothetical protein
VERLILYDIVCHHLLVLCCGRYILPRCSPMWCPNMEGPDRTNTKRAAENCIILHDVLEDVCMMYYMYCISDTSWPSLCFYHLWPHPRMHDLPAVQVLQIHALLVLPNSSGQLFWQCALEAFRCAWHKSDSWDTLRWMFICKNVRKRVSMPWTMR